MSLEDLKRKFVEQVKLRGFDDKYIDAKEEKEILQLALAENVTLDSARAALKQICEREGYALESAVMDRVREAIEIAAGNDGKIDEKEFNDAVTLVKRNTGGKKSDVECKRMVVGVIDHMGSKVKTGMFSNWFARVKKEVGMA
jgi:hypothetical protein